MLNPPKPERLQVTPFPEASFETVTVRVTDWPCKMVCELPPLKLTAIGGGGGVAGMVPPGDLGVWGPDGAVATPLIVLRPPARASVRAYGARLPRYSSL